MFIKFACVAALLCACSTESVGQISEVNQAVTSYEVVATFTSDTGVSPRGGLTVGPDGKLWGAAWQRGPNRVDPDATHSCSSTGTWDTDYQGRFCPGTLFQVDQVSGEIVVVHAFSVLDTLYRNLDGYQPSSAPVYGGDGWMYGTTTKGGALNAGTIYRVNVQTFEFQTLSSLGSVYGRNPYARLEPDNRGGMYLAVKNGGANGAGALVRLDLATLTLSVVYSFGRVNYSVTPTTNADGGNSFASPVIGWDGKLHIKLPAWGPLGGGTIDTITLAGVAVLDAAWAPVDPPLNADQSGLGMFTVAHDGRIYGTRVFGGTNSTGVIYRMESDGSGYTELFSCEPALYTTIPRFSNGSCAEPMGTLLEDLDGSLIGTSFYGGAGGFGSVFRITSDGAFTLLYSFAGGNQAYVPAGLVRAYPGSLYGVSQSVGGVLFRITL